MAEILVHELDKNNFIVRVFDGNKTRHKVNFTDEYWEELSAKKIDKKECVKKAFEFLLKKEPKESILNEFNMTVIKEYFPEFGRKEIRL